MGEKIIPLQVEEVAKPGKTKFWAVSCQDGRDVTVWDGNIASVLMQSINKEIEVEIKSSESNGKTYYNIREVKSAINPIAVNPSLDNGTPSVRDDVGKSIVAQCLVKAVIARSDKAVEIKEAVEMYKHALTLL